MSIKVKKPSFNNLKNQAISKVNHYLKTNNNFLHCPSCGHQELKCPECGKTIQDLKHDVRKSVDKYFRKAEKDLKLGRIHAGSHNCACGKTTPVKIK